jgi:hypothetical protein
MTIKIKKKALAPETPLTLLGVSKLANGSMSFAPKLTNAVHEGVLLSIWVEGKALYMSEKTPNGVDEQQVAYREIKRYQTNCNRRRAPSMFLIPAYLLSQAGIGRNDYLAYYEQGDRIVFKVADEEAMQFVSSRSTKTPAVDGEIRNGLFLRLTPETQKRLGVVKGERILISLNLKDGVWLELRKPPVGDQTPDFTTMCKSLGYTRVGIFEDQFEYSIRYSDTVPLPSAFLRKAKVSKTENVTLPFWFDGSKMIIEGVPQTCAVCGGTIRTYRQNVSMVKGCQSCVSTLETVRAAVGVYGSLDKALAAGHNQLETLIMDLANKVEKTLGGETK